MGAPLVALVTGGSAGLGESIASVLKRDGFEVAVCARREDRLAAMAQRGYATFRCDVANPADVEQLLAWIRFRFGRLDTLVNCAGIALPRGDFAAADFADVRRLIEVNMIGTLAATHTLLPLLLERGGSVVNFSSTLAQRPRPGSAAYSATKGALEAFTRALALETAHAKLRVYCVAPALVRSDIWIAAGMKPGDYEELLAARANEFPLGRAGEPEDVAELVSYLVSPRAAWLTGICIPVDGGAMLR